MNKLQRLSDSLFDELPQHSASTLKGGALTRYALCTDCAEHGSHTDYGYHEDPEKDPDSVTVL